jgi:hypothetical protein
VASASALFLRVDAAHFRQGASSAQPPANPGDDDTDAPRRPETGDSR